jgi:hypothetical protein
MFERRHRWLALAVASIATLAFAAPVSADTWDSNGSVAGTAFTASVPTTSILFRSNDAPATKTSVHCTSNSLTGTGFGPTEIGTLFAQALTIKPMFTSCSVPGPIAVTVTCETVPFRGETFSGGWATGMTKGYINDFECDVTVPAFGCGTASDAGATFVGNMNATTYLNGSGRIVAPATGTLPSSGQGLLATWDTHCRPLLGTTGSGTTTVSGVPMAGTPVSPYTATVTSAFKPTITKT